MARHGIPFIRTALAATVNGKSVKKSASVSQFLSTPTISFTTPFVNPCKPNNPAQVTINEKRSGFDRLAGPGCLFTSELTINVKKGIAVDWLKRMSENCYPYMKLLRIRSE